LFASRRKPGPSPSPHPAPTAPDPAPVAKKGARGIAAIGVTVSGLIGVLAALTLTGTLGRVQRDEPIAILAALVLAAAAGGLWALAPVLPGTKLDRVRARLKPIGIVLAFLAFAVALYAAVITADYDPRPQLDASLSSDHKTLTTTITASNLNSTRRMAIAILLLRGSQKQFLYRAYMGPTSEGTLDQTIVTPLPDLAPYRQIEIRAYTGRSSPACDEYGKKQGDSSLGSGTACVEITLPPPLDSFRSFVAEAPPGTPR
jgi:hypothetical protein